MPFYDYKCIKCNHKEYDVKRKITENVKIYTCPKCGADMNQIFNKVRRSFKLKGSGWAKDLYTKPKSN